MTCAGAFSAGWSLYVKGGKPVFRYTFFEVADVTINGTELLPEGTVTLKTEFTPDRLKRRRRRSRSSTESRLARAS